MDLQELEDRYGLYVAEMVRQALTLEEFHRLEIHDLIPYFVLRSERTYDEFKTGQKEAAAKVCETKEDVASRDNYLAVLRRRWERSQEFAEMVIEAESTHAQKDQRVVGM